MSEISMGEVPAIKAGQPNLENIIRDVAQKADIERVKPSEEPETLFSPVAQENIKSTNAITQEEFKKHSSNKVREAFKFFTDKGRLALATTTMLVAFGCGTGGPAENPNVSEPSIKTQTPAVSELPTGMPSTNIDLNNIQLPPTPEPTAVPTPTILPSSTTVTPESSSSQTAQEKLRQIQSNVIMIDFTSMQPREGLIQKEQPIDVMQSMLENEHIEKSTLINKYGEGFRTNSEFFAEHPKLSLLYNYNELYEDHGEIVGSVMSETWKKMGLESSISIFPVQNTLSLEQIELTKDDLGNKGIKFKLDTDRIIQALKQNPDQKVVNLSIQLGEIGVTLKEFKKVSLSDDNTNNLVGEIVDNAGNTLYYPEVDESKSDMPNKIYRNTKGELISPLTQENYDKYKLERWRESMKEQVVRDDFPSLAIIGAYTREKAPESLPELYKVARAIPDKLVIAAAGNHNDDLRETTKNLDVPNNVITVGQWGSPLYGDNYPTNSVFGAKVYVENSKLNLGNGSSLSTAFVSAHASTLFDRGFTIDQVKEKILAACETRTYIDKDGVENQALVFNPQLLETK